MPHVFRVVVDINLPVLELALDVLISVLVLHRFRSRSGSVGVNEAQNRLMGFSRASFRKRLSIYVRCCTRLAVDVRVNQLVHCNLYSRVYPVFQALDHYFLGCMSESSVE